MDNVPKNFLSKILARFMSSEALTEFKKKYDEHKTTIQTGLLDCTPEDLQMLEEYKKSKNFFEVGKKFGLEGSKSSIYNRAIRRIQKAALYKSLNK